MKIHKLFETTVMGFIALVAIASLAACSSESTSSPAVAASQADVSAPTAIVTPVPTAPTVVVTPTPTPEPEPTPDQPAGTPTKGDWVSTTVTDSFSVAKVIGETYLYTISLDYTISGDLNGTGELVETSQEHGGETGSLVAHEFIYFTGAIDDSDPGTIVIRHNRTQNGGLSDRRARFEGDQEYLTRTGSGGLANLLTTPLARCSTL